MPDYARMSKEERAAYMRDYRAKKGLKEPTAAERKAFKQAEVQSAGAIMAAPALAEKDRKIAELEEEIRRLKRELATRPKPSTYIDAAGPFAHLAPADRAYMERKLGGKKK